jgi:hypothetical protein
VSFDDQDSSVEEDEGDGAEEDFGRLDAPKKRNEKEPETPAQAEGLFESFAQAAPQLMAEGKLEAKDVMMLGLFEKMMKRDAKLESRRDLDEDSGVEDDEKDGAEEDFVRPGAPKGRNKRKPEAPAHAEGLFESFAQAVPQLMAEGKLETKDLMMLSLVESMMNSDARVEARRDSSEGEDDSEGEAVDRSRRGLRQYNDSNQIAMDIKVHPARIIREFERAPALSLRLKSGVPWTPEDVRKIGNWLKAIAEIRKVASQQHARGRSARRWVERQAAARWQAEGQGQGQVEGRLVQRAVPLRKRCMFSEPPASLNFLTRQSTVASRPLTHVTLTKLGADS